MKQIRYGILGPGYIAPRFVEAVRLSDAGIVSAVASRSDNKAKDFADKHEIPHYFTDYETLVSSDVVDVVYISTRHNDHYQHIMLALENHKHVLVEKPMVLTKDHAKACFDYARNHGLFLMEAQKMLFLPLIHEIKRLIEKDTIGELRIIETSFSYADRFEIGHWMISFDHGGGLYGTASYGLAFSQFFANSSIKDVSGLASLYDNKADRYGVASILFDNGVLAHTRFGTDVETKNKAFLYGSKGYIEINLFWKNDFAKLMIHNQEREDIQVETINDMVYEINHVNECLLSNTLESPIMSANFSIETATLIERIKEIITKKGQ